ncbi:MAG TPA: PD-(D/E)XK nuclease family protein [Candidatus Nanoarchaeia archaeon]|nr:PD-(D/E)XK nuclease family protein [Candidatus Nanoarchaeia archaeon]
MPTYSHSKISTFEQCRYKYKLKYIDNIYVDWEGIEAFMGKVVHETLEKLYSDVQHMKVPELKDLTEFYNKKWKKEFTNDVKITKDNYTQENYRLMGEKYLEEYYGAYKPFNHEKTLGLETENLLDLGDGRKYHIRIDRLSEKDGIVHIRDYKTSLTLPDQAKLNEDRQLAMYSIWVKEQFPEAKKIDLIWHFLAFNKELKSARNEFQLEQLRSNVINIMKEIEECKEFPTQTSALCNWCEYQSMCPEWKHLYQIQSKSEEDFKNDDGVSMVDKYAMLSSTISEFERERERIKEDLIKFSKAKDMSVIFGSKNKISVSEKEDIRLPAKEERFLLDLKLKEGKLWEELSELDTHKLKEYILENKLPEELKIEIEAFIERVKSYRLSMSKRKD